MLAVPIRDVAVQMDLESPLLLQVVEGPTMQFQEVAVRNHWHLIDRLILLQFSVGEVYRIERYHLLNLLGLSSVLDFFIVIVVHLGFCVHPATEQ